MGAEVGIGVGGGGGVGVSEIGVRTNRLNFAESKGKYTPRIVTEVTRVTSNPLPPFTYPQLPFSSAQLPLSPVPSSAHPPALSYRNDCSDKRKRFVGIRSRQTELWEIVVTPLLRLKRLQPIPLPLPAFPITITKGITQ